MKKRAHLLIRHALQEVYIFVGRMLIMTKNTVLFDSCDMRSTRLICRLVNDYDTNAGLNRQCLTSHAACVIYTTMKGKYQKLIF